MNGNSLVAGSHVDFVAESAAASDGALWLLMEKYYSTPVSNHHRNSWSHHETHVKEYYTIDPARMQLVSVTNTSETHNDFMAESNSKRCRFWSRWLPRAVAAVVLIAASLWLYKVRHNMSAGIAPGGMAVVLVLEAIHDDLALALSFLAVGSAAMALVAGSALPKGFRREGLVWAMYTTFSYIVFCSIDSGAIVQLVVTLVMLVMVGVLLNHPVLEIMGWVGGIGAVCLGIFSLFVYSNLEHSLLMIFLGILVGCGSVTVGYNLTKYRSYIVFYLKRFWRVANRVRREGASEMRADLHQEHFYVAPIPQEDDNNNDLTRELLGRNE